MPKLTRQTPPYIQIADHYRERIARGELAHGERLPPVTAIASQWGCAPGTAQRAIRQLRGEGLVDTSQQGSTVIGTRAVPEPAERVQRLSFPEGDTVEVTAAGVVPMLPSVGAALSVDADALNRTVIRREAISRRNGRAYKLSVMWVDAPFSHEIPELLETTPIPNVVALIGERTPRQATDGRDYVEARTADQREADALGLEVGNTVLAGTSVWRDETGPVAYYEWVSPAGHVVSSAYRLLPQE
ncbi:GntR family transcriptional regulator [Nocardiopsis alba]|uniref:GntR family transcriptional regulator n=1 Tax=Nocardiopsis alba TaxID=53437 RepID=UPI00366EAB43